MSEVKVNKISPRTNCGTVTVGDSGDSVSVSAGVPVTVNGDLKSNALKATDGGSIISQSGTTITIGASGDTVSLASGASQSGFGRSGSVDWETTKKSSNFTAASGEGYFVDTSSAAITASLPAGSAGAIVAFSDYTRTFGTNALTVAPNGSEKIGGVASSASLNVNGQAATFIYVDSTEGWINVQNAEDTEVGTPPAFVAATGGTITTVCTNFKVHVFNSPGTFTVTCAGNSLGSNTVDYLVIAGGGSGGVANGGGGGGGAGGYRFSDGTASGCYSAGPSPLGASALPVSAQGYPITVGGGGASQTTNGQAKGNDGNNSIFSTITSTAGGGAGGGNDRPNATGNPGGSGGGGGRGTCQPSTPNPAFGGTGNTPPVSPPQGNPGGNGSDPSVPLGFPGNANLGGGGGGAGGAGESVNNPPYPNAGKAGNGGIGLNSSITGTAVGRGGGGGGNSEIPGGGTSLGGTGGFGPSPASPRTAAFGGGNGAQDGCGAGGVSSGTANTGGGGGGIDYPHSSGSGAGGSGVVIIRYKFQ